MFIRIRVLWTVLTMEDHGVGQLRDAGDEIRLQLAVVVFLWDLRISDCARDATRALDRRGGEYCRPCGLCRGLFLVRGCNLVLSRSMRQAH